MVIYYGLRAGPHLDPSRNLIAIIYIYLRLTFTISLCLDVSDILCDKISSLLKQITLAEYSKDWSLLSSLRDGSQATYPTVTESLSHYIDTVIEPILRGILGVIDNYQNLELLFSQTNQIRQLWKIILQDDSLLDLRALIEPTCLRYPVSYFNHSSSISVFNCKFPFFFQVYKQMNQVYNELIKNLGLFLRFYYCGLRLIGPLLFPTMRSFGPIKRSDFALFWWFRSCKFGSIMRSLLYFVFILECLAGNSDRVS